MLPLAKEYAHAQLERKTASKEKGTNMIVSEHLSLQKSDVKFESNAVGKGKDETYALF